MSDLQLALLSEIGISVGGFLFAAWLRSRPGYEPASWEGGQTGDTPGKFIGWLGIIALVVTLVGAGLFKTVF